MARKGLTVDEEYWGFLQKMLGAVDWTFKKAVSETVIYKQEIYIWSSSHSWHRASKNLGFPK